MLADRPEGRRLTADEQKQLDDLEQRLLHGPAAPSRPRPAGWRRTRPWPDHRWLLAAMVVVAALLMLAVLVGGPGGLAATTLSLLATLVVCRPPRLLVRLPRPRFGTRRRRPPR